MLKTLIPVITATLCATAVAQPNPYQAIYHWGSLPGDRPMGVITGVHPDPDGEHLWIVERCGARSLNQVLSLQ